MVLDLLSKDEAKIKNQSTIIFIVSTLITITILVLIFYPFLIGDFLFGLDDAIYLPRVIVGVGIPSEKPELSFALLTSLGSLDSVAVIKFTYLAILGISTGLISLIFSKYIKVSLSVLFAVFATTLWVDDNLLVFVSGSHPILTYPFILGALHIFDRSVNLPLWKFVTANVIVMALLIGAVLASPVARIVPLALPVWLATAWISGSDRKQQSRKFLFAGVVSVIFGVIGYIGLGLAEHHYTNLVGWVSFSPEVILLNLEESYQRVINITFNASAGVLYAFALVSLVAMLGWHRWKSRATGQDQPRNSHSVISLGINMVITAALLFGPSSILVAFENRYILAPLLLMVLATFIIVISIGRTYLHNRIVVVAGLLLLLIGANVSRIMQITEGELDDRLMSYNAIDALVDEQANNWVPNSQVVLLLHGNYLSPSSGYNHWSTWYLRFLSNTPDIIGLIGSAQTISLPSPFIEEYADHGAQFWQVVDGRSRRIKMFGLERDRATFVYQQNPDGSFRLIDYVEFTDDTDTRYVRAGQTFDESTNSTFQSVCNLTTASSIFSWTQKQIQQC